MSFISPYQIEAQKLINELENHKTQGIIIRDRLAKWLENAQQKNIMRIKTKKTKLNGTLTRKAP